MKVILREDVKHLGNMGEIVDVSDGYARNYLVPKQLAAEANSRNLKAFEHQRAVIMKKADKLKKTMTAEADKLSSVTLTIKARAGDEDKLFGTVTTMQVAEALQAEGFDIDKKKISVEEPIKRLGTYDVTVKVHHDIAAKVKVNVVSDTSV